MSTPIRPLALLGAAFIVAGCATVPDTRIEKPFSARPMPRAQAVENNGAIFQPRQGMFLFEDRRARMIGDILTVKLVEKTEAKRKSETKENRSASAGVNVPTPTVLGRSLPGVGVTSWEASGGMNHAFKDDETNSNSVSGSITVTVVDVLENGNLVVAGEKQVTVNNDTEFIRLAGVVNPMHIGRDGSVNSTQLADVQIESRNAQTIDRAHMASMMARFFLTLLPF